MNESQQTISQRASAAMVVESAVDAFDVAHARGASPVITDFAPGLDDPRFLATVTELIRVDLERRFDSSPGLRIDDYRSDFPRVFEEPRCLSQIAFEEYRLRHEADELVDPREYERRFGVDTSDWPAPRCALAPSLADGDGLGTVAGHQEETRRLAELALGFPDVGGSFQGFELIEELGRGTFGRVFLSKQDDLARRTVVLKVTADWSLEPERLARLQHTNIVPIYSVHKSDGLLALCMPYFGRTTLADAIAAKYEKTSAEGGALGSVAGVLRIAAQLAGGLVHAHERGILHRDLKPANVLLADDGRAMLLDFNLSDEIVPGPRISLVIGGTLPYMAPEHLRAVRRPETVDARSDVYALGVVMFEMLTGRRPFVDRRGPFLEVIESSIADRGGRAPSPRKLNPAITPALDSIVQKCLHSDPSRRYQTAGELEEDLGRQLSDRPLRYAVDKSLRERTQKWRRRHPRLVSAGSIGAIAAAIIAVLAGLWAVRGREIAQFRALETYQQLGQTLTSARMALSMPDADAAVVDEGIQSASTALAKYGVLADGDWRRTPAYRHLDDERQGELAEELGAIAVLLADAELRQSPAVASGSDRQRRLTAALRWNHVAAGLFGDGAPPLAVADQRDRLLRELDPRQAGAAQGPDEHPAVGDSRVDQYLRATRLLVVRRFDESLPLLVALRDRYPHEPLYWLLLGHAHAGAGNARDAEGCYNSCVAMNPESYLALLSRARCRIDLGNWEAALIDLNAVIRSRPNLLEARLNRALAATALGLHQMALEDLDLAIVDPAAPTRVYFLRAKVRLQLGDQSGARADFAAGVRLKPEDVASWNARGIAQLEEDPQRALEDFREALRLNPDSTTALRNLVHLLADRLDRPREAKEYLDRLLTIDAQDQKALAGRAVIYARLGDRSSAFADVERLDQLGPDATATYQMACAYALTSKDCPGDDDLALERLRVALQADPRLVARAKTDPDLTALRGLAEFRMLAAAADTLISASFPAGPAGSSLVDEER